MRRLATHTTLVAVHALVGNGGHHAGGFTNDAGQRLDTRVTQIGDHFLHAKTAGFFVVCEGEMDGIGCGAVQKTFGLRQRDGDVTFHVGAAPAIQAGPDGRVSIIPDRAAQGIKRPVLPRPRHGVGMARQHDARRFAFTQGGKQVGLGFVGVVGQPALHPQPGQVVADEMNQLQVGVVAHRVHTNQGLREV